MSASKCSSKKKPTVASSLSSTLTLRDGIEMPMFGYGTSKIAAPHEITSATRTVTLHALKSGYRLIDTAQRYMTETGVGSAIRESGLERAEVFIVSKVWVENTGFDRCIKSVHRSLEHLDLDFIDLMLLHCPCPGGRSVDSYKALIQCQHKGLIRSIGVSNFDVQHLQGLEDAGCPSPAVNQIELNVEFRQKALVDYCRRKGIVVMGYSPLAKGTALRHPAIQSMAQKHKKTPAQVMIRWSVQNGFITIPKSAKAHRIEENADVFNFSLDAEDLAAIEMLPEAACAWTPYLQPWLG